MLEDLSVERDQPILCEISWEVRKSQHWCMLGANGSGKTTLLGVLTAYVTPTSGTVRVCGEEYGKFDWREMRKQIGIVSSVISQRMDKPLTALETVKTGKNAFLNYSDPSVADQNEHAMDILDQVECTHLAERSWLKLSQGEKQRVLIGRALMADPELLILDEPCAGLDPVAREKFLQFVNRLLTQQDGPTVVMVTHHVEEIMPGFSHVILLKNGAVQAAGEKTEVLTSRNLSQTFGEEVHLHSSQSRYSLTLQKFTNK